LARFKDAVLTITFLPETGTKLKSVDFVVYKFIEPNSKTDFEIRTKMPNATKKYRVQIKTVVQGVRKMSKEPWKLQQR
jgi:ribosomal protein S10